MEKFAALIPLITALLYSIQAMYHVSQKEWGWSLMWGAYALANLGIIIAHQTSKGT